MLDISDIFSSRARCKVLRTLHHQTAPLCLRHIAYLSGAPLFSVQRVLKQLVDEKMVARKRRASHVLFSLNRQHRFDAFLTQVFDLEMKHHIVSASADYQTRAKHVLHFSHSALGIIKEAKSWTLRHSSKRSSRS